jgi:electron transfer flavoprotein beta subunit
MKICVCVKAVPPSSAGLRLDTDTRRLVRRKGGINPPDEYALEEALRLQEEAGSGEVVIVSMSPEHAVEALRHGLAMGADRAVLIADGLLAGSDALATSKVLGRALQRENPDLVLCGWESTDGNGAMLWGAIAERLEFPAVSRVCELRIESGVATARRQMEYGFDVVETALPCLVAISGAINAPRYPSLKAVVASKKKSVEIISVADLGLQSAEVGESGSRTCVVRVSVPPARTRGVLIEDEENAAEQLTELLIANGVI